MSMKEHVSSPGVEATKPVSNSALTVTIV